MKTISTTKAPVAIGPYSQAIAFNGLLFCSGQTATVPETGDVLEGDVQVQAGQVIRNIAAILEAAGTSLDKVVKATCFLKSMGDYAAFNEVYAAAFTSKPARSCVAVAALPRDVLVEIEVIAEL
ncbi:MAG: RidA family protein [Christensenellaceae bacterium]|jgi:2-iminobutanoate/2-iminopropanoate deaminase|nr:RidA family protein [Christensenellaceae bacterium]